MLDDEIYYDFQLSSNSLTVRPINDLESNGFWVTPRIKAKKEQIDDKRLVIKLFMNNYSRFLMRRL
jgi:hypothetical protein